MNSDPAELYGVHSEVVALENARYNYSFTRTLMLAMAMLFGGIGLATHISETAIYSLVAVVTAAFFHFYIIAKIDEQLNIVRRRLYYLITTR